MRWRNLLTRPHAHLVRSGISASVEVSGMVCNGACARRVEQALAGLPGIDRVEHVPGTDSFRLYGETGRLTDREVDASVQRVVVLPGLRRILGSLTRS